MAITKPTPKDIGNYEAKFVGPFTQRQAGLIVAGAVPAALIATAMKASNVSSDLIIVVCIAIMLIPGFLAFGQAICYGMKPEDFVLEYYIYHIKSKNVRLYETNTLDDKLDIIRKKEEKAEAKKLGIETEDPKPKKKTTTATKTKFKDTRFVPYGHVESKEYRTIS